MPYRSSPTSFERMTVYSSSMGGLPAESVTDDFIGPSMLRCGTVRRSGLGLTAQTIRHSLLATPSTGVGTGKRVLETETYPPAPFGKTSWNWRSSQTETFL